MSKLHPIFETILADLGMPQKEHDIGASSGCHLCDDYDREHDQNCRLHPDYDPTPWCGACGARRRADCHCGPLAEND
jgi:hypothetical protein